MTIPDRNIVITGFMGSGKTTVARVLALSWERDVIDLDEFFYETHDRTPAEIIESQGETTFRQLETELLAKVLTQNSRSVIALGGGTWITKSNRDLLRDNGAITIWLDAPFELCWSRIQKSSELRPLAVSAEEALNRYGERREIYQMADLRVPVNDADSVEAIQRKIDSLLQNS